MINLSSHILSKDELSLLSRGPTFCPTPLRDNWDQRSDLQSISRKIRLLEYFHDSNINFFENESTTSNLKNQSNFIPHSGRNSMLDKFCDGINSICKNLPSMPSRSDHNNLSSEEIKALKELRNNENIVIKVSDKGNNFCILNKEFYVQKVNSLLSDSNTYCKLNKNNDNIVFKKLIELIVKHKECLNENEFDFLKNFQWFTANFYALPKCHKSDIIKSHISKSYVHVINPEDLQFRPIVGGPQSPTSRLCKILDVILKPLVFHVKNNLKDEMTMISTFNCDICNDTPGYFASFDIKSMYTNITLELVLKSVYFWLNKYPSTVKSIYSWTFIRESLVFFMKNNHFDFGTCHYVQLVGGAMGAVCMSTLGTLAVGFLEETYLFPELEKVSHHLSIYVQTNFYRYQDDSLIFLPKELCHPEILLNILNKIDDSKHIQYEMEFNELSLNFLSLRLYKVNNKIQIDVHYKDTNQHTYLHFHSCHPTHVKRGVPFTLARRLCQIVDDPNKLKLRLNELSNFLLNRKYPLAVINNGINRATSIPQQDLRNPEKTLDLDYSPKKKLNFIVTHNPRNADIRTHITSAINFMKCDKRMQNVLKNIEINWTYKQPQSLKTLLCPSRFGKKVGSISKCGDKRCNICSMLILSNTLTMSNGKIHAISHKMTCNSIFCIYSLTCNNCHKMYIGECDDLRARINNHVNQIKHAEYRKLNVSKHLFNCGSKFQIFPLFIMDNENIIQRKIKEEYFIFQYDPELNVTD